MAGCEGLIGWREWARSRECGYFYIFISTLFQSQESYTPTGVYNDAFASHCLKQKERIERHNLNSQQTYFFKGRKKRKKFSSHLGHSGRIFSWYQAYLPICFTESLISNMYRRKITISIKVQGIFPSLQLIYFRCFSMTQNSIT